MLKADRNPFFIRAFNRIGPFLALDSKLDFDQLIRKARKNTNLQALGSDFNEEALKRLINAANEEARLHPFGKLMLREKLISQLENRLWAEYWFQQHP